MLISPAWAHGSTTSESVGSLGPFIILGFAIVFVLALVADSKLRKRKQRRLENSEVPPSRP